MARGNAAAGCFVCRKPVPADRRRTVRQQPVRPQVRLLLPGGPVGADDLAIVSRLAPGSSGGPVNLGHLLIAPHACLRSQDPVA
jgi:hypothetical protein